MQLQEFNIASNSDNETEAWLSNLSINTFEFNWITYASIEAFWQSLKFEEWSDDWKKCIILYWIESKKYWNKADDIIRFKYLNKDYIVWSIEHQNLMKDALREQLKQNNDKLQLLLSTSNSTLVHKPKKKDWTYYPDSIKIPWEVFSRFLMELREEFKELWDIVDIVKERVKNI